MSTPARDLSALVGRTFHHEFQPYTRVDFVVTEASPVVASAESRDHVKFRAQEGWVRLVGTIVAGTETAALWCGVPVSPPKDMTGRHYIVEVPPYALDEMSYRQAAC